LLSLLYYVSSEIIISCSNFLYLKIITVELFQNNYASNCREYIRQFDWNIFYEFYRCKKATRLQIEKLQVQITRFYKIFQYTDINAQSDRIILNKLYSYLQELQYNYSVSEAAKVKYKNQLHKKRQKYCLIEEILNQKRYYAKKVERNLK